MAAFRRGENVPCHALPSILIMKRKSKKVRAAEQSFRTADNASIAMRLAFLLL